MNREIKFDYVVRNIKFDEIHHHVFTLEQVEKHTEMYTYMFSSNGQILARRQFTGLLDKNGKEIYESDLFDAWNGRSKYVVEWQEAHACFKLVWVSGDVGDSKVRHYFDMYMAEYQFEPVGNIYENSELLKGE